ncbi:hypothetical protein [Novosphingobium sp. AP12]|uniref:hypothetical protein n=1 Tax=Novosphingobium sp. AP12 TaxID=1144305 RepID=UPI000271E2EF|nr:hypothetical protein [Novosphingobium sp. AP12]EJL21936.1 hypothetical protein PMI02_04921 [Novosphingobium sp. AP12]
MTRVKIRFLTNTEVLRAIGSGAQTYRILDRLRPLIDDRAGEHLLLAQMRRKLRQMERDGIIRQPARWNIPNALFWEPAA